MLARPIVLAASLLLFGAIAAFAQNGAKTAAPGQDAANPNAPGQNAVSPEAGKSPQAQAQGGSATHPPTSACQSARVAFDFPTP
jgi:hypothetical protein